MTMSLQAASADVAGVLVVASSGSLTLPGATAKVSILPRMIACSPAISTGMTVSLEEEEKGPLAELVNFRSAAAAIMVLPW
jgi:hypothetical protein